MKIFENRLYLSDLDETIQNVIHMDKLQNSRILITGVTGTIGSFLVDTLVRYNNKFQGGIKIYAAGRNIEKMQQRFGTDNNSEIIFLSYDMMKPIGFDNGVDYIIHAAGNAHPAAFNGDPVGTIMGNVQGTYQLLSYAKQQGAKRFLYVSSGEVYGQGDVALDSFSEDYVGVLDINSPRSCYPMSKRTVENLCSSYYSQFGLETVMVRPCHTYGPYMTESDSRANVQFMKNALAGQNIVLKSAGTQMRSYCYVADCASAILTVLLNGEVGESYNIANSTARTTIAGLAETIAKVSGTNVIFEDPTATDIANRTPIAKQVLNSQKLESLGWKGQFSVDEGIEHTYLILKSL